MVSGMFGDMGELEAVMPGMGMFAGIAEGLLGSLPREQLIAAIEEYRDKLNVWLDSLKAVPEHGNTEGH